MVSCWQYLYRTLQIEEKIPVEVCKTTRKNENAVTINRGTALRKEGEKRRKPITKSKGKLI